MNNKEYIPKHENWRIIWQDYCKEKGFNFEEDKKREWYYFVTINWFTTYISTEGTIFKNGNTYTVNEIKRIEFYQENRLGMYGEKENNNLI